MVKRLNLEITLEPEGMAKGSITLISAWLCPPNERSEPLPPRLPLNLIYLASAALKAGYRVYVRDLQFFDISYSNSSTSVSDLVLQALHGSGPLVGVSCMSDMLPFVVLAVREWKCHNPEAVVVLGGPGPGSVGEALLQAFEEIDVVAQGEGDQTIVELLHAYYNKLDLDSIRGISFRRQNQVIVNAARPRIVALDNLMPLHYRRFPITDYYDALPVATSRGCPFHCTFCAVSHIWGHKTTWHSTDAVVSLLSELAQINKGRFIFTDDTFVLQRRRVITFCESLCREGPSVKWHCCGRINLMDEALISEMAKGGCNSIFYGIESGSISMLKVMQKGFTPDKAIDIVSKTCRHIPVTVSFIWGFPDESWEDFESTRELYLQMNHLPRVSIQVNQLQPYPGTPLYSRYKNLLFLDLSIPSNVYPHRGITDEEYDLIRKYPSLFSCFYRFPTLDLERKLDVSERDRNEIRGL